MKLWSIAAVLLCFVALQSLAEEQREDDKYQMETAEDEDIEEMEIEADAILNIEKRSLDDRDSENCTCDYRNLKVHISHALRLPKADGFFNGPDPYVLVIAIDCYGNTYTRRTSTIRGNRYPVWNEWLFFGHGYWETIKIKVFDKDYRSSDDLLLRAKLDVCDQSYLIRKRLKTRSRARLEFSYLLI